MQSALPAFETYAAKPDAVWQAGYVRDHIVDLLIRDHIADTLEVDMGVPVYKPREGFTAHGDPKNRFVMPYTFDADPNPPAKVNHSSGQYAAPRYAPLAA